MEVTRYPDLVARTCAAPTHLRS